MVEATPYIMMESANAEKSCKSFQNQANLFLCQESENLRINHSTPKELFELERKTQVFFKLAQGTTKRH